MYRSTVWLAVVLLFTMASPGIVRACPMCSDAVPATSGADEDDAMREARAYNDSINLMAGMPYLMLTSFSFWVYRGLRRHTLAQQNLQNALASEPTDTHGSGTSLNENVSGTSTSAEGQR